MSVAEGRALMRREILAQPDALAAAAEPLAAAARGLALDRARPLWMGSCGDGLFAAQALAGVFRAKGWDLRPTSAGEMLWEAPIRPGDGVVGVSISGGTRRTAEALERATALGARTVAVTLDPDSRLGRACGATLRLPYAPISRATPHSLDHAVTLLALAALAGLNARALSAAAAAVARAVAGLDGAERAAADLPGDARFFFLGGGPALGSAAYGAAKLHEAGGLPAWAFEAENACHGANFAMRPGDVAVLCGAGSPADRRTEALEAGLRRMGLHVLRAGMDEAPTLHRPFLAAVAAQALCLGVAEARGLDVTDPGGASEAAAVQRDWFAWPSA